jgi:hypothetical protein
MNRESRTLTLCLAIALLTCIVMVAVGRVVQAEDDCNHHTFMVKRLPVVGLACIGEPSE